MYVCLSTFISMFLLILHLLSSSFSSFSYKIIKKGLTDTTKTKTKLTQKKKWQSHKCIANIDQFCSSLLGGCTEHATEWKQINHTHTHNKTKQKNALILFLWCINLSNTFSFNRNWRVLVWSERSFTDKWCYRSNHFISFNRSMWQESERFNSQFFFSKNNLFSIYFYSVIIIWICSVFYE